LPADAAEAAPAAPAPCIPLRTPAPGDIARYARALEQMGAGRARKGATLLRAVAENGLAPAQHRLAQAYARGEGVDGDFARARHWAARAAEAGHVQAMHDLGVFCLRGEGGARDEATALRWFSEAARFGHRDSQFHLGRLHQEGRGVRADADEALYWFLLAARQGDVAASGRAAEVAFQLTMARIEAVQARVSDFRPAAANVEANEALAPQRDRARRRA
jgi:localization factor PodJL